MKRQENDRMPIPEMNDHGLLPPGVHECSLEEIRERFGCFQSTDRRSKLFGQLETFVSEVRSTNLVESVVVDGSFVTSKDEPNDIDIVVVLSEDHDFSADLRPFAYNVLSKRRVRKRYDFDVLVARSGHGEYDEYVAFFQQVRGEPDRRKGILMVRP